MRHEIFIIFLTVILCSCSQKRLNVMGNYESSLSEQINDGMNEIININTHTQFNFFKVEYMSNIKMKFLFSEQFKFSDIELYYQMNIKGDWTIDGDNVKIELDSTTFEFNFEGSNAKLPTEKTMVRNLKKYIKDNYIKKLNDLAYNKNENNVNLKILSDSLLLVRLNDNDKKIMMHKTKNK